MTTDPDRRQRDDELDDDEPGGTARPASSYLTPAPREAKVFEVSVDAPKAPLRYKIRFSRTDGEPEEFEFEAHADGGAGGLIAATSLIRITDSGKRVTDMPGMMRFFERAMTPESFSLLQELLDDPDLRVPMDVLGSIYTDIVEEWSGRPTQPSRALRRSQRRTGL